jgi:hypothetical protein
MGKGRFNKSAERTPSRQRFSRLDISDEFNAFPSGRSVSGGNPGSNQFGFWRVKTIVVLSPYSGIRKLHRVELKAITFKHPIRKWCVTICDGMAIVIFCMRLLEIVFFTGVAGSSIVVVLSFIEDFHELFEK